MTIPRPRGERRSGTGLAAALRRKVPPFWPRRPRAYLGDLVVPNTANRFAIVTTITDNFIGLGAVFLLSLHERLARRGEIDVILLQAPDIAPLGEQNRILLARLCPGLRIIDVDTSGFLNADNMARYSKDGKPFNVRRDRFLIPSKKAAYVKLNVLRLTQYEKVLLMDSDMLVVSDFSEAFDLPHELAAAPTGAAKPDLDWRYIAWGKPHGDFNTGFMLLGRRLRGARAFEAALRFLDLKRDRRLRDQSVFNRIFRSSEKLLLPDAYNHKLDPHDPEMLSNGTPLETAKIIHFVARSKWSLKDPAHAGEAIYDHFHALQARTGAPFILEP